jgi:hypothetical protein
MRRAFIAKVKSGLEKVLLVEDIEPEIEAESELPPTPEELLAQEHDEEYLKLVKATRRIQEIRRLLFLLPRGLKNLVRNNPVSARIRELLDGVRLDTLPGDLLEKLNDLNII